MVLLQFRYVSDYLEQGYGTAAILDYLGCASLPPTLRASQCACDLQPPVEDWHASLVCRNIP